MVFITSKSYTPIKISTCYDAIEGNMAEVKGVRRRTQLLDDLRNRRRYWELKEEAEDRKSVEHKYLP